MNNSGTADDAKDVFQEALIVVFENIRKDKEFRLVCTMQTYFYSVARIIWIKHLNRIRKNLIKFNEQYEFIEFTEPEPFREHDFRYALYQKVFLDLPEDCQKIVKMSTDGLSSREIALKMGFKSSGYIDKRRHFCKQYLIKLIKEHPEYNSDKM
jgi:RNA polymerase sigma factor (sigma-70 family)